jgi:hypothetical protein
MAGQFYLGEAIKFSFTYPYALQMDLGTGAITATGPEIILADINVALMNPNGVTTTFALNALPGYITLDCDLVYGTQFTISVSPGYQTFAGRWSCVSGLAVPQVDYCDVLPYYNPQKLTQKFLPELNYPPISVIAHYDDPESAPVQIQQVYNIEGGNAATYADITAVGPIVVL